MAQRRVLRGSWIALGSILGLVLAASLPRIAAAQVLIGETTARFEWQPAPGDVEFYEVYVSRSSRNSHYELEQVVPGTVTQAIVDAEVGELVRVRVRAGNSTNLGPMSPPSEVVRFGLPPELPMNGSPGVVTGRVAGSDEAVSFFLDPETSVVWSFQTDQPSATPVQLGLETDADWQLAASGDFDGDGVADLFWHHANGATRVWFIEGSSHVTEDGPPAPGPAWQVEATGDFDGNGQDDVFWRDPAGPTLAWLRNGVDYAIVYFPAVAADVWELLAVGDFDGDGLDDVFWRDVTTTDTAIWFTRNDPYNGLYGKVRLVHKRSLLWELFETYDHDGDGREDVHWRVKSSPDLADWWHLGAQGLRTN